MFIDGRRAFHSHCLREGERREMSRETMYVKHCMGVNGLEKIILRENRGFSAEVSFSFSDSFFNYYLIISFSISMYFHNSCMN